MIINSRANSRSEWLLSSRNTMELLQHHYTITQRPPKKPMCQLCRNHGKIRPTRGHKRECPHRDCHCDKCVLTIQNRKVNAAQVASRRLETKAKKQEVQRRRRIEAEQVHPPLPRDPRDYTMMDDQFANVQPVVRQWPLISPFFLQQQTASRHGSYYNYRDPPPCCYWMEQTAHPTQPAQKITRIDRFQSYPGHDPAAYLRSAQQNTVGLSYPSSICQNVPNGRSAGYRSLQPSECSHPTENNQQSSTFDTGDSFGSAHSSLPEHRSFDNAVASVNFWNSKEYEKQQLDETVELTTMPSTCTPKSTTAAGNYSIDSLLKAASHVRDSDEVVEFAREKDGKRESCNVAT